MSVLFMNLFSKSNLFSFVKGVIELVKKIHGKKIIKEQIKYGLNNLNGLILLL